MVTLLVCSARLRGTERRGKATECFEASGEVCMNFQWQSKRWFKACL